MSACSRVSSSCSRKALSMVRPWPIRRRSAPPTSERVLASPCLMRVKSLPMALNMVSVRACPGPQRSGGPWSCLDRLPIGIAQLLELALIAHVARARPQALEGVEVALLGAEGVHHHVHAVDQHPAALALDR